MSKKHLKNLINFELKHTFGKEYLTKKEIRETLDKMYKEGFIIIHNKSAIPVYIECDGHKILSILEGNGLSQDLLDLYGDSEAEKVKFSICFIDYESGEVGYGGVYNVISGYWLSDKIEGKIKEVILSALNLY